MIQGTTHDSTPWDTIREKGKVQSKFILHVCIGTVPTAYCTNEYTTLIKVKQSRYRPLSGPEGSRKLRFPNLMTTAQDGGKVVSLTHRAPLPPGNTPGTHFC